MDSTRCDEVRGRANSASEEAGWDLTSTAANKVYFEFMIAHQ